MTDIAIISLPPGGEYAAYFSSIVHLVYGAGHSPKENVNEDYLHSYVIALKDGEACGRLCIYRNEYLKHNNEPILLVGNFECIDDSVVATALFEQVAAEARVQNVKYIVGPMNGSTWDTYRLPLTHINDTYAEDLNYPEYYNKLFSDNGFVVMHRYYTAIAHLSDYDCKDERVGYVVPGVTIRNIDLQNFEAELKRIYPLCAIAFRDNVLFSPIDAQGFVDRYLPLAPYIDPEFVFIAEDDAGIVALFFCYPDVLCKRAKRLVVKTIVRHPQRRYKGLVDTIARLMYKKAGEHGYTSLIHAFAHKDNKSFVISGRFGGSVFKEYALLIKTADG